MSCCPPAPEIVDGDSADVNSSSQDSKILPGESVECYMKRAENPSGKKDDLEEPIPDKIDNTSIPVAADATINVTFRLTNNSTTPPGLKWFVTGTLPTGISLNPTTGQLTGPAVPAAEHGKTFTVLITAARNSPATVPTSGSPDFIDSRSFSFVPATASKDDIQFVHPLPGQPVSSPFGPRQHPVRKTQGPHKGVDFNSPGSQLNDVLAAADGTVTFCGNEPGGAGNYIKIDHRNAGGVMLCQTVYMHLSEFYVAVGQKVAAGQKIGKEGNTGVGTGPHLHFECRIIKNGQTTWVDPIPFIRGPIKYQPGVGPGAAAGEEVTAPSPGSSLSVDRANAAAGGCAPFGPAYPKDPEAPPPEPVPSGGVFDQAWLFTMKYEVGPHWLTTAQYSPGDADLDAGKKDTTFQRKQVGYKNSAGYPGGETKFGIAQGPNPNVNVSDIDYASSKQTGYDNYWRRGSNAPSTFEATKPKTAVMLFDMMYLHGAGNVKGYILSKANIDSLNDVDSCKALQTAQEAFINEIVNKNPSRERYKKGWITRSRALLSYALSLP